MPSQHLGYRFMRKLLILTATCTSTLCLPFNATAQEHGFIEDSKLTITAKNYYINTDNREHQNSSGQLREWGQGFIFDYKSGFTQGTVGFGVDAIGMVGYRLDSGGRSGKAGIDRNPGTLFPLKRNGKAESSFGSFGAAAKVRVSKTEAKYGTFIPNMPVIVANNGRLLPQTFDGGMITSNEFKDFTFLGGKLEHAKGRASTNQQSLSVAGAGTGVASNKFYFGGVEYTPSVVKNLKLSYYYGGLKEFYNQHFLGLNHKLALPVGSLTTDVRYFYSDSNGKNGKASGRAEGYRIKGYNNKGEVDNQTWSLALTYKLDGHSLTAGYQSLSGNSQLPYLDQGSAWSGAGGSTAYVWTDSLVGKFVNAGERTWFAQYAFDFADIGVPGLTASIKYLKGSNLHKVNSSSITPINSKRTTEWERDIQLAYKIQSGPLKNLEFAWKNGMFRSGADNNMDDNRLIATYTIDFDLGKYLKP